MAYTFLKAQGYEIGTSLLDADSLTLAKELMEAAKKRGVKFLLPVDVVIADRFAADAAHEVVDADQDAGRLDGVGYRASDSRAVQPGD
jgi:phosphoglycerate kinase